MRCESERGYSDDGIDDQVSRRRLDQNNKEINSRRRRTGVYIHVN